jgi:hypothetical protein
MTTKHTDSHSHATSSSNPSSNQRSSMPTKKNATHAHSTSTVEEATVAASQPAAAASPPATATSSPASPAPLVYLTPPPANAFIPAVPSSFVPESGTNYKAIAPKKAELATLPLAVADLQKFTSYATVVGSTAPPYEEILDTFTVTNQWSSMRTASSAWDVYSQAQEGICWTVMRPAMESLKSAFNLAATRDPSLPAKYAGLSTLLGVKAAIAQKGASTKRLNKKAEAEGKPPIHGGVGKKRVKAANKALVAAAAAAGAAAPGPVVASPPATTAPATPAAPPATANGAPVNAAPATGGTAPVVNGANGTGH